LSSAGEGGNSLMKVHASHDESEKDVEKVKNAASKQVAEIRLRVITN
jgi:hypothetical protein